MIQFQELATVMSSLGSAPPWAVLQSMIDKADSDRNGKVFWEFSCLLQNRKLEDNFIFQSYYNEYDIID